MTQVTRCPACGTHFKVVADQLRVSEGYVRCGQCDDVFNAKLYLEALPSSEPSPATKTAFADKTALQLDVDVPYKAVSRLADPPTLTPAVTPEVLQPTVPPPTETLSAPPPFASTTPMQQKLADAPVLAKEALPMKHEPLASAPVPKMGNKLGKGRPRVSVEAETTLKNITFLKKNSKTARWQDPFWRVTLSLACFILLLVGVTQVIYHERDRLAATQPRLKPWLQALCKPVGCVLSPLKNIDAILVDGATFTKLRDNTFQLSLTLKNSATTALAMPALELTLTDTLDQPLLRRVFFPADLKNSLTLAPESDLTTTLSTVVDTAGLNAAVVGYRVRVFYP